MRRGRGLWIVCLLPILVACSGILPTVYVPTATPAHRPVTPEATATPLFRAREITSDDYGQSLTLYVGDEVILHWLPWDSQPLTIGEPDVVQVISDPAATPLTLKAIAAGATRISSIVVFPCPTRDPLLARCQPPEDFIYFTVTVLEP